jgi:DNA ligase-4
MDVAFSTPFIFEVVSSKFAKPPGSNFFMLIFPRVTKLHQDRTILDCPSFQELQEQAEASCAVPEAESQETREWVAKLERRCKRKVERMETCSPRSSAARTPEKVLRSSPRIHVDVSVAVQDVALGTVTPRGSSPAIAVPSPCSSPASESLRGNENASRKRIRGTIDPQAKDCSPPPAAIPASPAPILLELSPNILSSPTIPRSKPPPNPPPPTTPANLCNPSTCLLSTSTIYLAPCISTTPYITQNLLPVHSSLTIITSLSHWSRQSFSHPPLTSTVSESQAFPGQKKLILVERHRWDVVTSIVEMLEGLEEGQFRERVEVWDWRVAEVAARHGGGGSSGRGGEVMGHFLGALGWDSHRERARFVWR